MGFVLTIGELVCCGVHWDLIDQRFNDASYRINGLNIRTFLGCRQRHTKPLFILRCEVEPLNGAKEAIAPD